MGIQVNKLLTYSYELLSQILSITHESICECPLVGGNCRRGMQRKNINVFLSLVNIFLMKKYKLETVE